MPNVIPRQDFSRQMRANTSAMSSVAAVPNTTAEPDSRHSRSTTMRPTCSHKAFSGPSRDHKDVSTLLCQDDRPHNPDKTRGNELFDITEPLLLDLLYHL